VRLVQGTPRVVAGIEVHVAQDLLEQTPPPVVMDSNIHYLKLDVAVVMVSQAEVSQRQQDRAEVIQWQETQEKQKREQVLPYN